MTRHATEDQSDFTSLTEANLKRVLHYMYGTNSKESLEFKRLLQEISGVRFSLVSRTTSDAVRNGVISILERETKGAKLYDINLSKEVILVMTNPSLTPLVSAVRNSNRLFNLFTELAQQTFKRHRPLGA
jgi:hypothetical protein